jgi:hypothetical protein
VTPLWLPVSPVFTLTQGEGDDRPSPLSPSKMAEPTPICTSPLATEDNATFRPQRMFHAASVKALLPPGKGVTNEINIVINNLPAKLINR